MPEGRDRPDILITSEMIDAGVDALAEFQEGDGSNLADRVVEVYLQMFFHRPSKDIRED
jgi:hypothetical protein